MSDFKQLVRINASIQSVYENCLKYFQNIDYEIKSNIAPARIEFSKKGTIWTADDIDASHKLFVFLNLEGNTVLASFHFDCPGGAGSFTQRSVRVIESEINALLRLIYSLQPQKLINKPDTERICIDCKKDIPSDANLCPYCGKK